MDEVLRDFVFVLRFYPFESAFIAILCGGVGLMVGAVVMRWALS
jgi:hypothetical protein